jgi:hypothetical protein
VSLAGAGLGRTRPDQVNRSETPSERTRPDGVTDA